MAVSCLKPLAILILPFVMAWLVSSFTPIRNKWALRLIALLLAMQVACFAVFPAFLIVVAQFGQRLDGMWAAVSSGETLMMIDGKPVNTGGGMVSSIYRNPQINAAGLHGLAGFEGVDVVGLGDSTIYAPFDGVVDSVGCDGVDATSYLKVHPVCGVQATWLDIRSADGRYRIVLLHGDYDVTNGQTVKQGQPIGRDNCWGWCTGNHSHIILWDRGVLVNYLSYVGKSKSAAPTYDFAKLQEQLARLGYKSGENPLRVSHYDPSLGGTNCDSDCSTMASGQKVADWVGGQNGIYAAACPAEWPFGTRFELYGKTYQCQDRGGWIKTRQAGEYDPAMGGFTAGETYHWVDLLDTPPVPYGALVYDWQFAD